MNDFNDTNDTNAPDESGVYVPSIWSEADFVHVYTRRQALEDGVLVALDPALAAECGFRVPVAVTASVFSDCIALTEAARKAGNDVKGRTWDVLFMTRYWIQRQAKGNDSRVAVTLNVVRDTPKAEKVTLHAHCGPGDDGEPVITIMYPGED